MRKVTIGKSIREEILKDHNRRINSIKYFHRGDKYNYNISRECHLIYKQSYLRGLEVLEKDMSDFMYIYFRIADKFYKINVDKI